MNKIAKSPLSALGYNFIDPAYLPKGKDEYYQRNKQNRSGIVYRQLSAHEIETLVRNNNSSDNWNNLLVSEAFNAELVRNCKFYGLVRIGKLEPYFLEFHTLRMPVGLYNSTIISCDIGDNVVIDQVNYLSHYIIGNEVMIVNVNELDTSSTVKFGNGIIKEGESESVRIWLEVCNENGGRKVMPFVGMLPGDAYLWAKYRDDEALLKKFAEFTQKQFDDHRGYYGKIGDRTVIKNCRIIKDTWIGSDAYIKGANKIKNVTIKSNAEAFTQIGEGCELVNGIISEGCRVFYGVKAVRFVMASHSQLKYGARLINSYLGNNSTISCCEVLNSLIFPSHEQHHNNSFLCASLVMGQSNMAAGATIGSNHNSRSPDGELKAGRGFWPGLCVSLKHNSRFASFNILAKGDYPYEMDVPFPFALISQDHSRNHLIIMPAYWYLYNVYALARNEWKYNSRDLRIDKVQRLEFNSLAPDTITEIIDAIRLLEECVGYAAARNEGSVKPPRTQAQKKGSELLEKNDSQIDHWEVTIEGIENSERPVVIIKARQAWHVYKRMLRYYVAQQILSIIENNEETPSTNLTRFFNSAKGMPQKWVNIGGQLMLASSIDAMRKQVREGKIKNWDQVHLFYQKEGSRYDNDKAIHAWQSLRSIEKNIPLHPESEWLKSLLKESVKTKEWLTDSIYVSRAKDYSNPFRRMLYDTEKEMNSVVGSLADNEFIRQEKNAFSEYKSRVTNAMKKMRVK